PSEVAGASTSAAPAGADRSRPDGAATAPLDPPGPSPALRARFGEPLSRLHAMVETLSRQGRIDHLLPDLPAELVPIYSQLIESDVPEVLTRRLVRHVAEALEPDQFDQPESIRGALCDAVAQCIPVAPPIQSVVGTRRVVALVGP